MSLTPSLSSRKLKIAVSSSISIGPFTIPFIRQSDCRSCMKGADRRRRAPSLCPPLSSWGDEGPSAWGACPSTPFPEELQSTLEKGAGSPRAGSRASALCWGSQGENRPRQGDPGKFRDSRPLKVDMWSSKGSGVPSDVETRQTLLRVTRFLAGCPPPLGAICPRLWLGPRPLPPCPGSSPLPRRWHSPQLRGARTHARTRESEFRPAGGEPRASP